MVRPKTPNEKECPQSSAHFSQNVKVFAKCRPLKPNEINAIDVFSDRKEVRINESKCKTFKFDNVFDSNTPQIQVYRSVVQPLIEQVVKGYNCTVFVYGQTGTGKTYTLEGERSVDDSDFTREDDPTAGIIPRALHQLFETLLAENTIEVSYLSVYHKKLYDLLSSIEDTTNLKLFVDSISNGSVCVSGIKDIIIHSKEDLYDILEKGSAKRQMLTNSYNLGHSVFSVTVRLKESDVNGQDLVKMGRINFVNLILSENTGLSDVIEKRAREAADISQSALNLEIVIKALSKGQPLGSYRGTKLTQLLKESLGGGNQTALIATFSPDIADAAKTLHTLKYAKKAKKIVNKPVINRMMSQKTLIEYNSEINKLRRLSEGQPKSYADQESIIKVQKELKEQTALIQALCAEVEKLNHFIHKKGNKESDGKSGDSKVSASSSATYSMDSLNSNDENVKPLTNSDNKRKKLVLISNQKSAIKLDQKRAITPRSQNKTIENNV